MHTKPIYRPRQGRAAVAAVLLMTVGLTPIASAQDALSQGDALDANSRVGSRGRNVPTRNFARELQLRSAIVTGNAPGGRSFRGDVGYTAANDFRGSLGSNDLFDFQRDSLYSGLATLNVRGLNALRFGLEQPVANQTTNLGGALIVNRAQGGRISGQPGDAGSASLEIDPFGYLDGAIRSTTDHVLSSARFPRILDSYTARDGMPTYITATDLLGVRPIRANNSFMNISPLGIDNARPGGALDPQLPTGPEAQDHEPGVTNRIDGLITPRSTHEELIESLRIGKRLSDEQRLTGGPRVDDQTEPDDQAQPDKPELSPQDQQDEDTRIFNDQLERLRDRLATGRPMIDGRLQPRRLGAAIDDGDDDPADDEITQKEMIERARKLLGNGTQRLEALIAKAGVSNIYELHMKRGQELLAQDRWFDAEERFSAALRAKRGDPMASAGRVTAQIGAGMFRSASINLTNLLIAYPEMINTRLNEKLFPRGERLEAIRSQLYFRAAKDTDIARYAAFLLTHIGFQSQNQSDIDAGFAALDRIDAAPDQDSQPSNETADLEELLRSMWQSP